MNHLLPDDDIYAIISELYRFDSNIRMSYLISYTLTAYIRDIERVSSIEDLDLRHLPSLEEEKLKAKEEEAKKAKTKHKKGKKKKKIGEEIEYQDDESSTDNGQLIEEQKRD